MTLPCVDRGGNYLGGFDRIPEGVSTMEKTVYDRHMHLRFTPQLAERAQRQAVQRELSVSELVRQALREYLDTMERAA